MDTIIYYTLLRNKNACHRLNSDRRAPPPNRIFRVQAILPAKNTLTVQALASQGLRTGGSLEIALVYALLAT